MAKGAMTTKELNELKKLEGMTILEMSKKLNRHISTVRRWCNKYGVKYKCQRGIVLRERLVFAEDIAGFMELRSQGLTWNEIATNSQFSASTITSCISKAKKYGMEAYPSRKISELVSAI
jgi:transposase